MDKDTYYSQQGVEENTVLTQGRIILWAGGSLANDGSTVSRQCSYIQQCVDVAHVAEAGFLSCYRKGPLPCLTPYNCILKCTVPRSDVLEMRKSRAREGGVGKQKH